MKRTLETMQGQSLDALSMLFLGTDPLDDHGIIRVLAIVIMVVISVVTMMLPVMRNILTVVPLTRYKEDPLAAGMLLAVVRAPVSGIFKSPVSAGILADKRRMDVTPRSSTAETV